MGFAQSRCYFVCEEVLECPKNSPENVDVPPSPHSRISWLRHWLQVITSEFRVKLLCLKQFWRRIERIQRLSVMQTCHLGSALNHGRGVPFIRSPYILSRITTNFTCMEATRVWTSKVSQSGENNQNGDRIFPSSYICFMNSRI